MNDRSLLADRTPLVFAGSPLDRGDVLRRDEALILAEGRNPAAQSLVLQGEKPAMDETGSLVRLPLDTARILDATGPEIYLGRENGTPLFAIELAEEAPQSSGMIFVDARRAAMGMPHDDAAVFAQAKSLFAWRARHRFCANCGSATEQAAGGAKRVCPDCHAEHFPRVDPVVIMLAIQDEQCLLGRQESWPEGMWSALAGFVEPAETLEEACARELEEESGVKADIAGIRYVMTQPWPFPSSIMVGMVAPVLDATLTIDTHELEQARWFSRDEVRAMLDGTHPTAMMPPSIAIARRLTELWVDDAI